MRPSAALVALLALLAPAAAAQAPAAGEIVINEIMYDPPAPQPSANEWIEVVNRSNRTLDLAGLVVTDAAGQSGGAPGPITVAPGGFVVFVDNSTTFAEAYPGVPHVQLASFPSLNNTGDRIGITVGGVELDAVDYLPSWGGADASLERRDPSGPSTQANFGTSTAGATPGAQNSIFETDTTPPELVSATASPDGRTVTVTVSEPLDPASVTAGAFTVTGATVSGASYTPGATTVALTLAAALPAGASTVTASGLRDLRGNTAASTSTTVTYSPDTTPPALLSATPVDATTLDAEFSEPLDPASVQPADFTVDGGIGAATGASVDGAIVRLTFSAPFQNATGYTLTVTNVADGAGNVLASGSADFFFGSATGPAPGDVVINEILYDPPAPQPSASEWIELYNRSDRAVDLAGLVVTDATGQSGELAGPRVLPPGGYLVVVARAADFAAAYPGVPFATVTSFPTLNNSGDRVGIAVGGVEIDVVDYTSAWGGTDASLERRDPDGPAVPTNFGSSTDPSGGTPGRQNSIFEIDVTGPFLVEAAASLDGRSVTVTVTEPLDAASVTAGAFTVGSTPVTGASYTPGETVVALALGARLPAGLSTVTATGLRDTRGNTTATTSTSVSYAPDTTPPTLLSVAVVDATTLDAEFSEPLDPASVQPADFSVSGGVGAPVTAAVDGGIVRLTFAAPFTDGTAYTLTVTNVSDASGNALASGSAPFFFGAATPPAAGDVVINEILYDPPAPQPSSNEWIELYNRSDRAVDLGELVVTDGGDVSRPGPAPLVLAPGAYLVLVANGDAFAAAYPGVPFVALAELPSLNNTGDRVALIVGGVEIDAVPYTGAWGGTDASLERRDPRGPSTSAANFGTTTDPARGTPGRINAIFAPDTSGPTLTEAVASPDGRTLTVVLSEPADPASVTASAFAVAGRTVTGATYDDAVPSVALTLDAPLAAGATTVTATGLTDLLGNVTATTSTTVDFTPDVTPPAVARAFAPTATSVRVVFTEPVTDASAAAASAYALDGGVGAPTSVAVEATGGGGVTAVTLALAQPLAERTVYALTATGLTDLAGNVAGASVASVFFGMADTPEPGQIVVNEILYDPASGSDGEFVELFNPTSDRTFDLSTLTLDGDPVSPDPVALPPGGYAVVARDAAAFAAAFPGVPAVQLSGLSLSNSGDTVVLAAGDAVIDSLTYDPDWHREELDDATGISLERREAAGASGAASNWSSSLDPTGATPGRENTATVAGNPQERDGGVTVTSPFAPDDGEAARITYTLDAPAGLVRVRIFDAGGRLVREVEDGRLSGTTGEVVWDGRSDAGQRLRAGIYIVLLEAVDVEGGTSEAHRAAIVLARR